MKTQLATALALSLFSGAVFAAPSFYGEIDVSIDYLPEDNRAGVNQRDVVEINSNSSFVGLKGEEKVTERLNALYQAEFTIHVDDGESNSDTFVPRNLFVGLKDAQLGTVKVGKIDTPLKQLSGAVDNFNNYVDNKADVAGIFTGENRIDNVVVYESPAFKLNDAQLKATLLLALGEASGIAKGKGASKVAGRGLGDAFSSALVYDNQTVLLGVGYDKAIPSNFAGGGILNTKQGEIGEVKAIFAAADTLRATGRVNLNHGVALKALYQTSEVAAVAGNDTRAATIDDSEGWLIGAEYNLPAAKAWTLKAQYSQNTTRFKGTQADFDAQQLFAGAEYALNKQLKSYAYAGLLTLEQGPAETKQPVVGTGFEYKF